MSESKFMSLSKNDFMKAISAAIFGAAVPLIAPFYDQTTASLLAG